MEELIKNTTDYFDYLINEVGLCASVHFLKELYPEIHEKVMVAIAPYIIHRNPYCIFVNKENHHRCIENQRSMITETVDTCPREHICYANAREIIYPISRDGAVIGFLSVNGYKGDPSRENLNDGLWNDALVGDDIPRKITDTLMPPLRVMIEKLLKYDRPASQEINMILRYVSSYPQKATLTDIARHFGRSKSHVSHLFKSKTGKTVRAYCNELKLFTAQNLLRTTSLSVTEVGLEAGFEDTSYFVRLYREKYGVTPYQYRKSNLTSKVQYSIMKKNNKGDK